MNKTNPWLILCDLDGTLLKNNGIAIDPYNIKVIKELTSKGHIFVIMTGRPPRAAKLFYHQLALQTYMGTYNGANIVNLYNNERLGKHIRIEQDIAEKIINEPFMRKYARSILIESENSAPLFYKLSSYLYDECHLGSSTMGALPLPKNEKWFLKESPITIMIETHEDIDENSYNAVLNKYIKHIIYRKWPKKGLKSCIISITDAHANKKDSGKIIAEHYGIARENVMCFGDGSNDFEMFTWAGHPVRMLDHSSVLEPFNAYQTKFSNENAGVGHYLNDFFKLNINK